MKPLSETYKELGIAFTFPIVIIDTNGNRPYYENSDGFCCKCEYDSRGKVTYFEDNEDNWYKCGYDSRGNETYFENSEGFKRGTARADFEGKVIEVDGVKYKLTAH